MKGAKSEAGNQKPEKKDKNWKARFSFFWLLASGFWLLLSPPSLASSTDEVISQVQSTYDSAQDVSSEFTQKVKIPALEREVEKMGKAYFKKPGKFYVEYEGEDGRLYVSDGKKLWVYEKGDSQVNVYPLNSGTMPEEALAFLGGLGDLKRQFKVSPLSAAEQKSIKANEQLDWLLLHPKNPESHLDELLLGFDRTTHTVDEAYLKNETGNVSHYFFKNVKLNANVADSQFVFSKPKGVKEIKN
jgi:outer membrane lipoprotein carrier protein